MNDCTFFVPQGESPRAVNIAQGFIGEVLKPGDTAVDATTGNGNDTLFMARAVGQNGRVYSFDVQGEALAKTSTRLEKEGLYEHVTLLKEGHQFMQDLVKDNTCKAVMFNLGYLPGGNKEIVTLPETTLQGTKQALTLLVPGGRMSMVVYRGHPGAMEEANNLDDFISTLEASRYWTARITFPNRDKHSPYVILVQKKGGCKN